MIERLICHTGTSTSQRRVAYSHSCSQRTFKQGGNNTILVDLDLSHNSIVGEEGARDIASALEANTTLTALYLKNGHC